ncbi:type II secretion system protein N [Sulfitobacter sp. HNIBRBA3233]|uniref:type II secretion system protein N n=1 Tax=Sulfitobacter marinivivus TaxID=3158558 RepID=UPI0032DEF635
MASDQDGTPTPEKVKELATTEAKLDRMALLGVFGSTSNPSALIRLPRGGTQRVDVGDSVNGRTVQAIGADRVVLSGFGGQMVISLPRG